MSFEPKPLQPRRYDAFDSFVVDHLNTCDDRASCPCWLPDLLALNDPFLPGGATDPSR